VIKHQVALSVVPFGECSVCSILLLVLLKFKVCQYGLSFKRRGPSSDFILVLGMPV